MNLTPVENHAGLWMKREDLHTLNGVNGSKLRACEHLIEQAHARGYKRVVSASSVLSPQSAMAATVAASLGMPCDIILGGTKPHTAVRHPSIRLATEAGATFHYIGVGYNPALQSAARKLTAELDGAYLLNYGIAIPPDAATEDIRAFHAIGGLQVQNLPPEVRTLVVPFGSGNTAAGILYGLCTYYTGVEHVTLMGIGPDRLDWLHGRLSLLNVTLPFPVEHAPLHPHFATYGDVMRETVDGVVMHPTYEGKIIRWAKENQPGWWTERDSTACLWVVGGPLR
jgi:1-aminocyclopropane-1-carboxylate deaminase/D-cysteine desulfhydrase-like pyridoxal-dependent ACC family enzyme